MIANKDLKKEKSKQATFISKPTPCWYDSGDPKAMGLYIHQKKNKKKK